MTPDAPATSRRNAAADILVEGLLALLSGRLRTAGAAPQPIDSHGGIHLLHSAETALMRGDGRGPAGLAPRTQRGRRTT